jgi:demethylmenaquinone methyltransferase/2-methoxy-6-polyprenyl-1,4-benzoquinol methylase
MLSVYEQKAAFFDTQARSRWACEPYDQGEHDIIDRILSMSGLKKGMRVLEPGCGAGRLTEILSDMVGYDGEALAVDLSEKMSLQASIRTKNLSNCRIMHASIEDHMEAAQDYDMIICHNMFHHLKDKGLSLSSMRRSLKPEGKLIIFHFFRFDRINDPNGKIHASVKGDTLPCIGEMENLCVDAGLRVERLANDHNGYFLEIVRRM